MGSASRDYVEAVWVGLQGYVSDFKECVREVQRSGPSVEGIIGGMDFQQFSAGHAFFLLKEMQDSVRDDDFFSLERKTQTRLWAAQMEDELRRVFGESFDLWYKRVD